MIVDIIKEMKEMKGSKLIVGVIFFVSALSYGYLLIHPTVGMDDTGIERYFVEGYAPHVGRWTIYLLNLFFDFAHYVPWFTDLCGVILLGLSAYLFCFLWNRISNGTVNRLSLVAFSTVFMSFSLVGEVYIFYLHNGVSLAFFLMALTGLQWWYFIQDGKMFRLLLVLGCVSLAIGCYESFALVFLVLFASIYLMAILSGSLPKRKMGGWIKEILSAFMVLLGAIIVRSLVCQIIAMVLEWPADARGFDSMKLWLINNPIVLLKDLLYQLLMRYVLNGKYIFSVNVFVITVVLFFIANVAFLIVKRKISILPWVVVFLCAPWLLVFVELVPTPYRAAQALMLFVAMGLMISFEIFLSVLSWKPIAKIMPVVLGLFLLFVGFRQSFELNRFFYFDALKSEYDENYCRELASELERGYDTSKPVAFVGQREMPQAFCDWMYLNPSSDEYIQFIYQMDLIYTKALYKFVDNDLGYRIYDIAAVDTVEWLTWAMLDEEEREIYPYMRMLGYSFKSPSEEVYDCVINEAIEKVSYPVWPEKGSIVENDDYICVYIGRVKYN